MFTTNEGARQCAKRLHRLLERAGLDFPLGRCQAAIARAAGYRDWNHLAVSVHDHPKLRMPDPTTFNTRLVVALPDPCRGPVATAIEAGDRLAHAPGDDGGWWSHVFPYVFASAVIHRAQTAELRPGSGPGQRLRERLVVGLLLNVQGGERVGPTLDPETLTTTFRGDLAEVYRADAGLPGFETEIERLSNSGILEIGMGTVKVRPPAIHLVTQHVLRGLVGKAEQFAAEGGREAVNALRNVLLSIGVQDALRLAEAIMQHGSDAFDRPHGAALEALSGFAAAGDIALFARACRVFRTIMPRSAEAITASVTAKIINGYLARHRGLGASQLLAYTNSHEGWADTLKRSLVEPVSFVRTVEAMETEIVAM